MNGKLIVKWILIYLLLGVHFSTITGTLRISSNSITPKIDGYLIIIGIAIYTLCYIGYSIEKEKLK